jgi:hypothetical protein
MRPYLRFAAAVGALTLGAIAVAPAVAAAPLAQAGANAVTVSVAGNAQGTGNVTATDDGSGEQKTGETSPQIPAPGGGFFSGGVAAQEATATAANGTGRSAACAGIAGDGGTIVNIGDSECLSPGDQISGSLATFDPGAQIDATLDQLPPELAGPLAPLTDPLQAQLDDAFEQALGATRDQFGDMGLVSAVKVISGQCTAGPGGADGSARIVDGTIRASGGGQDITLLELPVNPPPNTHLVTDLSKVLTTVIGALRTNLNTSFDGAGSDLNAVLDPIQDEVVDNVVTQVEANLGPLEENVLDITLNKQERPEPGAIRVNALDLQLVPAAQDQLDASLASVQIGNVVCGPNGRAVVAAPAEQAAAPQSLPTAVSAGLESAPGAHAPGDDSHNGFVLAAFALMLAGGTAVGVVRWLRA